MDPSARVFQGTYVLLDILKPIRMALLDMLSPEVFSFEELRAFRHFASELGLVFLLHKFGELFLKGFDHGLAAKLLQVYVFRFKYLQDLFFKRLDPVEST